MSDHAHHSPTLAEPDAASASGLGIALACLAIGLAVTAYFLYGYFIRETEAVTHSQVLSLQSAALQELHAHEEEVLGTYGVVDAGQGTYRVPLEDGIKLFVQEARSRQAQGIPQRLRQTAVEESAAEEGSEAAAQ